MKAHNQINVTVDRTGIYVWNDLPRLADGDEADHTKVWGTCGEEVVWVVTNNSGVNRRVRIPLAEIVPSPKFDDKRPQAPLDSNEHTVDIPDTQTRMMRFRVKDVSHFPGLQAGQGMTYKYTIYSNGHILDPDIEINRP